MSPLVPGKLLRAQLHVLNTAAGLERMALPRPHHYSACLAFICIARKVQHFLPSSARVEFCLTHAIKRSRQKLASFDKKSPVLAPEFEIVTFNLSSFRCYHWTTGDDLSSSESRELYSCIGEHSCALPLTCVSQNIRSMCCCWWCCCCAVCLVLLFGVILRLQNWVSILDIQTLSVCAHLL